MSQIINYLRETSYFGSLISQVDSVLKQIEYSSQYTFVEPITGKTYRSTKYITECLTGVRKWTPPGCQCKKTIKIGSEVVESRILLLFEDATLWRLIEFTQSFHIKFSVSDGCCVFTGVQDPIKACLIKSCHVKLTGSPVLSG
jgi:hypothetical protein